jgi:hypothetical protein
LSTNTVIPLVVIVNNSSAFSANVNNMLFYATPGKPPILNSHIISLNIDGEKEDLFELSFDIIVAADVDKSNNLCLFTNEGFKRLESDKTITTIHPIFENDNQPMGSSNDFAVGPDNNWYVISSDLDKSIEIYKFDDFGNAIYLPILFNKDTFGGAYRVHDASIDMGDDGRLAIIITAMGSLGNGPYYQRIYTANSDGSDLIEVANLDSNRIGGMVDIAISSNNDIFVLTVQDRADVIYKIAAQSNIITEFIWCEIGHDPESMDVDPNGNVWITTTKGIYVAEPRN